VPRRGAYNRRALLMKRPPRQPLGWKDARALVLLASLFFVMLAASWQRWTQPLLDHGREMNLPARILAGEHLYADVQFLYGPFAPHFNALLYWIFGVHLSVLKASGIVSAILILLAIYWLSRQLMGAWESAATTGLVLVLCALKSTANYVQPYAFAALYGLVFSLFSLVFTLRFLGRRSESRLQAAAFGNQPPPEGGTLNACLAGAFAGLALISKPEIALAALAAAAAAFLTEIISFRSIRRGLWRDALLFAWPVVSIVAAVYSIILSRVPLRVLLDDNHVLFTNMPPQLIYFNRGISGLADLPGSLWFTLAGFGVFALWAGICVAIGALISVRSGVAYRRAFLSGLAVLLAGALWRAAAISFFQVPSDVTPFASAALLMPVVVAAIGWRSWRAREAASFEDRALVVLGVFSLVSTLRAILNVTTTGPYTPFFLPVLIVVCLFLLFRVAPALITALEAVRERARVVAMTLIGLLALGVAINSATRFRRLQDFHLSSARGGFLTSREIGEPLQQAIRYVEARTGPDDYVLALPVATTINFLAARRYPLREEIVHPGFLTGEREDEAIERIRSRRVPLILVANLDTSEFRDRAFGVDYNVKLMDWIMKNYRVAARFDGPLAGQANFGKAPFFITVYERGGME
jgi:4-amino-4-deoxy-L-arabinose transferase-like glycosyltransferase